MAKSKGLYKLTPGDRAIFERARSENNPNWITNYYLRNESSGTYWRPVTSEDIQVLTMDESKQAAEKWMKGYETLHAIWEHLKKPDYFGPNPGNPDQWQVFTEENYEKAREELDRVYRVQKELDSYLPVFHHPHGVQFIDWQLKLWRSKHPIQVIPGGFGSAKTFGKSLVMLCRAITLPGYRALAIAPFSIQANEVHKLILQMIEGTLFERFLIAAPTKPFPHIVLGNDYVGKTTIECYPGDDPGKFLTLTVDEALIDQAEKMDGSGTSDIETLVKNLGTRFRGTVKGRPRVAQMTFVANSADNPQLWDLYDESLTDPDYVFAYSPGTFENIYLTVEDLKRFEKQVGKDETARRIALLGERPVGSGEHFSAESINKVRSQWLDDLMRKGLDNGYPNYVRRELPRVAVHRWELPPEPGRRYVVVADPGWGNPPYRNAAGISVWDVTDFPHIPASLRAFDWTFGNNSPNPWIAKYTEYVQNYHAIGFNGFDATGFQSGYERMTDLSTLLPTPVSLSGQKKFVYLNLTKKMVADGKFQAPIAITHLYSQMSKYNLPDDKLRQDLVMMLLVLAAMVEPLYYQSEITDEPPDDQWIDDRYYRGEADRYQSAIFDVSGER